MSRPTTPQIFILDFGSQYTHLIARRIRQLGVLAVIKPPTIDAKELSAARGLILSGGPQSVHDQTAIAYNERLFDLGLPMLGLCYGHQLLVQHFGGQVQPGTVKEYGFATIETTAASGIFQGLAATEKVWISHGDAAVALPAGFAVIGRTKDCPIAAVADQARRIYGLQFHPEVAHTEHGLTIIKNFVFEVCGCQRDWSTERYWQQVVAEVTAQVGSRRVFMLVSGGVDSTVAFAVLEKVLGTQRVFGLHIDSGFMRQNESALVKESLAKAGFDNLVVVDASQSFLRAVAGVAEPEQKREIIGRVFLEMKDEVMQQQRMDPAGWLVGQGTIYPDTIETGGTAHADKIKTHHNRVKEVLELMNSGRLVEPLVDLYKDEVRALGKTIGLPDALLSRHPFPGPGLAIRVLCSDGKTEVSQKQTLEGRIQAAIGDAYQATVLPIRSVGVQGDNRTYRHPVLLSGPADWPALHDVAIDITNTFSEVNRVVYLVAPTSVQRSAITLKAAYVTKSRLDRLRQVDDLVNQATLRHGIDGEIWQMPIILAPLSHAGGETIILRPVQSQEAMTVNFYRMDWQILNEIATAVMAINGIDLLLYDVTNKPPGTIEWE